MQNNVRQHVYLGQPANKVKATLDMLKYFKSFLASKCTHMCDPVKGRGFYLDKQDAKSKMIWLINVAINRKAGVPDVPSRKYGSYYQTQLIRDIHRVRDRINHRIVVHQFETEQMQRRYRHLLSDRQEW